MEEIEKAKMTRTKKTNGSEVHQVMTALTDTTIRGIVRSAKEEGIKREDIVSLIRSILFSTICLFVPMYLMWESNPQNLASKASVS